MKYNFLLLNLLILFACENAEKTKQIVKDSIRKDSNKIHLSIVYKDKIAEKSKCKVYLSILPSEEWIDSMRTLNGEDEWDTVVDDNEYYRGITKVFLDSTGYTQIEEPGERIWKLRACDGSIKQIDSDTLKDKWGTIIFDGIKEPFYYDGIEPDVDLKGI